MNASQEDSADLMDSLGEIKVRASDEFFPCKDLLNFEIPNDTPWRLRFSEEHQRQLPSFKDMIEDIVRFQCLWKSAKGGLDPDVIKAAKQKMRLSYIHNVNVEEGIGTQDLSDTEEIINNIDENIKNANPESKKKQETKNLYSAWIELVHMATEERKLDPTNCGLLEMKQWINKIHKTLMTGVIDEMRMTAPGVFSIWARTTTFDGEEHTYPQKETEMEWEREILTLLDRYNSLIEAIKKDLIKKQDSAHATLNLFKCVAWFLFSLVSLHPFSDGNGRLCRLLASYTLLLVTPFPSPIHNIFSDTERDDYVKAIVRARKSQDCHPDHLAALIIESNWAAWKEFFNNVKIEY